MICGTAFSTLFSDEGGPRPALAAAQQGDAAVPSWLPRECGGFVSSVALGSTLLIQDGMSYPLGSVIRALAYLGVLSCLSMLCSASAQSGDCVWQLRRDHEV